MKDQHEDEAEHAIRNASFGFVHVDLETRKRPIAHAGRLGAWSSLRRRLRQIVPSDSARYGSSAADAAAKRRQLVLIASFLDSVLTIFFVPLRIGFAFDPWNAIHSQFTWTNALTIYTIVDLLGHALRFGQLWELSQTILLDKQLAVLITSSQNRMRSFRMIAQRPSRIAPSSKMLTTMNTLRRHEIAPTPAQQPPPLLAKPSKPGPTGLNVYALIRHLLLMGLPSLPVELVFYARHEYNLMHIAGLGRFLVAVVHLPSLFNRAVLKSYRTSRFARAMAFSTVSLSVHLFWIGLYLCHVAACGYMWLAHYQCGVDFQRCAQEPLPGCWVLKDHLEHGSAWRQYIRTMYWASKTITTLGQGDLVPATMLETQYCAFMQYVSGLWATAFLSACGFYFSRRDMNMTANVTTHLEQALRVRTGLFVSARAYTQILILHPCMPVAPISSCRLATSAQSLPPRLGPTSSTCSALETAWKKT